MGRKPLLNGPPRGGHAQPVTAHLPGLLSELSGLLTELQAPIPYYYAAVRRSGPGPGVPGPGPGAPGPGPGAPEPARDGTVASDLSGGQVLVFSRLSRAYIRKLKSQFEFRSWVGFRPKLGPGPLPTAPA